MIDRWDLMRQQDLFVLQTNSLLVVSQSSCTGNVLRLLREWHRNVQDLQASIGLCSWGLVESPLGVAYEADR